METCRHEQRLAKCREIFGVDSELNRALDAFLDEKISYEDKERFSNDLRSKRSELRLLLTTFLKWTSLRYRRTTIWNGKFKHSILCFCNKKESEGPSNSSVVRPIGVEPTTPSSGSWCSIHWATGAYRDIIALKWGNVKGGSAEDRLSGYGFEDVSGFAGGADGF